MNHKDLLQRRLEFYTEIKNKVESYLGRSALALTSYKKAYFSEVKKLTPKASSQESFFKALKHHDVLLFGDFHSEPQSVRSLLRVCRKLTANNVALGLECVHFNQQHLLEKYMSGDISEADFIQQTNWNKNWDFPFEFVKPIFHWASLNKVPIYGINKTDKNLAIRDKKIAQNIKVIQTMNPNRLLIVQIGDYHLAKKHLPIEIKKVASKLRLLTVFQSPDDLYFKLLNQKKNPPDFIQFNQNQWAVMAVLPWVKWQNYLLWLESSGAFDLNDEDVDMTDHIARCVLFLADTLKIPTETSEISVSSLIEIDLKSEFKSLDIKIKNKIHKDLDDGVSFFVPEKQTGYLESYSLNHICKISAEYFLYKNNIYKKTIWDSKKYFLQLIWTEMLTYFFTKIINPKRKASTVFDMRTFLMSENFSDHGKDVLSIALGQKLKEMNGSNQLNSKPIKNKKLVRQNLKSYSSAARLLGGIMGEKIFWAYTHQRLKFPEAQKFLFQDLENKLFHIRYYELIEIIDSWPTLAKSKFDQF